MAGEIKANQLVIDGESVYPSITTVGGAAGAQVSVTFKAIDGDGSDVAAATPFRWVLSSSATTGAIHTTAPSVQTSLTTGVETDETTAGLAGHGFTDVNGDAVLLVDHAADAQDYYLWLTMGGTTVTSTKIEVT